jgi:hypothetical protein
MDLDKPNNKLVNAWLEHFWCTDNPWANTNSQNSPQPKFGGSHHLPPYSILCPWPWDQHPNVILSWDSQVWVPKFPKLGLPQLWGPILSFVDLWLRWGIKQSCSLRWKHFNDMWKTTWMQGNRGNSWFLVVGSQIGNLTPDPSFAHNLHFRYPNGSCEPILDIYIPRAFQWYKELFNLMSFDSCNRSLKIRESIGIPIPKMGVPLGVWGFIPSHYFAFSRTWNVTPGFLLGPHSCKPLLWSWAQN